MSAPDDKQSDIKLKLSGYSYVLGDAAMMAAMVARGKSVGHALSTGGLWAAGGIGMGVFGNPKAEKQIELLANKLETHLAKQGYAIPATVREQNALLKKESFWEKITDFFYEHPSEILNASFAIGSSFMVKGALSEIAQGKAHAIPGRGKKGDFATDLWIGAIVGVGALIGLFAKEDPKAHEKVEHGNPLEKAVAWVQEKPLRASSALYFVNNGFLLKRALQDRGARGNYGAFKPHYFSSLQLACYVFANSMLMLSPRNQIAHELPAEGIARLEDAAARIIGAQSPELQQALLADVSEYLAREKGIQRPAGQIAQELAARITELTSARLENTAEKVGWVEREAARKANGPANPAIG